MYLEKLEIQGFKSFANKNILVFPGMLDQSRRGLTAVVGPNGSGKSNVADAIRWVLGEQSMKTLRGKKSDDVIFSGSDKKGKLGMAEVSLYLNNEDGQAPIDYPQIVLTRRLYRDGSSEYLLNNSRVRLLDVQILLAKSKFGQRTYSVIGQGMVEGFLNTSLSERKEFFDEATGVKQYQIKRDDSLNKLRSSYENLSQAEMLINEIEPRLKSLTRQVGRLQRKEEIEKELRSIQLSYYGLIWREIDAKYSAVSAQFLEQEKIKMEKDRRLDALNQKLNEMEIENSTGDEFSALEKELGGWQAEKDKIGREIMKIEAQQEVKMESAGQFDLSWMINKKKELSSDISQLREEMGRTEKEAQAAGESRADLQGRKIRIDQELAELNGRLQEFAGSDNDEVVKKGSARLEKLLLRLENIDHHGHDELKTLLSEIKLEIQEIIGHLSGARSTAEFSSLNRSIAEKAAEKEELLRELADISGRSSILSERLSNQQATLAKMEQELKQANAKLDSRGQDKESGALDEDAARLSREMDQVELKLKETREKLARFSDDFRSKQAKIFNLQKEAQKLQNEINEAGGRLNELKVESARFETRLESLEAEIRSELGGLKEAKESIAPADFSRESAPERIHSLKRQIEAIGGIDPEVEKEYAETKERYDFLFAQVSDLKSAIESLEKVIKELDMVIKEQFDLEFKLISEKFEEYFKILFNGGNAKIIKVLAEEMESEEADAGTEGAMNSGQQTGGTDQSGLKRIKYLQKYNATGLAGIEIQATPPGKKIKSVAMLSGGERALTAIALICAIISANPSPFVVLDEVDAALDEANSERLARILDDLSHKTQFIVVTHNRASMRRANILYGITMQDDGVSKLLSVKLDEVKMD